MDKTTVTIPLPPNYVPRQGPRQAIYEKVAKGAVSHNGSSGSHGCWVVITGPAGCGKSVILGELLKEVRATRLFEDVVTVRFHEDSKIDQGLHDMVTRMQHQNGAVGKSDRRLLVLDNFDQMNSAIRREANKLDQYFKCVVTTTNDPEFHKNIKADTDTVVVPEGFALNETYRLFCDMFHCDEVPVSLKPIITALHDLCNGAPLKLRIVFNGARSMGLGLGTECLLRWQNLFNNCKSMSADIDSCDGYLGTISSYLPKCMGAVSPPATYARESTYSCVPEMVQISHDKLFGTCAVKALSKKRVGGGKVMDMELVKKAPLSRPRAMKQGKVMMISEMVGSTVSAPKARIYEGATGRFPYKFSSDDLLGTGRSKVFKGIRMDTGDLLAVKEIVLPSALDLEKEVEKISREFQLVSKLSHKNLLRYYDLDKKVQDRMLYLVMEFCEGGSLKSAILRLGRVQLTKTRSYLKQILEGLCYLHTQKVAHLDLKGENVLLTKDDQIKIGDFGEMAAIERSLTLETEREESVANIGTIQYMSPEMIRGQDDVASIGQPSDVWSFGCLSLELLTGRTPRFQKKDSNGQLIDLQDTWSIMFFVGSEGRPLIPTDLDIIIQDFLSHCFKRDFVFRWTSCQLLEHDFLTEA